jgi:peptidoglycan hydrolase-like protein with peptidoglycan-binding domain
MRERFLAGCAAVIALALAASPTIASASPAPTVHPAAAAPQAPVPNVVPANAARLETLPTAQRLLDTRQFGQLPFGPGETRSVQITGAAPLPAAGTAVAAVLNLTVTGPSSPGYWTAWPSGTGRPDASILNIDEPASALGNALAMPNLVTVPVGADGSVSIYADNGGQLIVDLLAYYTPAASSTSGRFVPLPTPTRILDSRPDKSGLAPGDTRTINIPQAVGAAAVALNVTTIAWQGGYWQLFPNGAPVPATSNLNSVGPGAVSANQVIVPVDAAGNISVFSTAGGDLIIDVVGTFTSSAAPDATDGLFVPLTTPTRFVDTRGANNPLGNAKRLLPGWAVEVPALTNPSINRPDVAALAMNVTISDSITAGYFSVTTAGSSAPGPTRSTSTLNATRPAQTLANHTIVPVSARGFEIFSQSGGQVIADVSGYYLGTPAAGAQAAQTNTDPTPAGCVGFAALPVAPIVNGSSAMAVSRVQQRLLDLGFWTQAVDGGFGRSTSQAVLAFQKWAGLKTNSAVDDATANALNTTLCRPNAGRPTGDYFEVDRTKQIAFVVRGGKVMWAFNVSTGNGKSYDEEDQKNSGNRVIGTAITPLGDFKTYRESDVALYQSDLGTLYRPKFVVGGIAVHGASNVPNYPASHGCIRVINPVMDLIWGQNLLPLRSPVWIHD